MNCCRSTTIKDQKDGTSVQKALFVPLCGGDGEEEEEMILVTANTEIVPIYEDDEEADEATLLTGEVDESKGSRKGSHSLTIAAAAAGSADASVVPELELTPR